MKKNQKRMALALAGMMFFALGTGALAEAPAAVTVAAGVPEASGTADAAGASEAADRTDLAAEDYNGTWTLKEIRLDGGYVIPTADMGLTGTVAVGDGTIEITDVYGQKSKFETVFEGGFLYIWKTGNG